jgi:DNA adenine methylase
VEKLQNLLLPITEIQPVFPDTKYMGSKKDLLPFIFENVRKLKFENVLDAFSGSACVSFMFKQMSKKVDSNDFLRFCFHIANGTIVNQNSPLTPEDLNLLLKNNKNRKNFVKTTFGEMFFSLEEDEFLDNLWANIQELRSPFKKSLALAAVSRACMKKRPRGIFTFTGRKNWDARKDLKISLQDQFIEACKVYNLSIFDNQKENKAFNKNVFQLNPDPYDLVYIDTPYVSPYSDCDYVRRYHFVEGFSRYWKDTPPVETTLTKKIKSYPTEFSSKKTVSSAFEKLFNHFKKSKLVVSYSSNSIPNKLEMIHLLKNFKKKVQCFEKEHLYSFGNHSHKVNNNNNHVKEYLFVGED